MKNWGIILPFGGHKSTTLLEIKKIYKPNVGESVAKMEARMKNDLLENIKGGGSYEKTNICDSAESDYVLKGPDRNGGAIMALQKTSCIVASRLQMTGAGMRLASNN